jgi:hypothetical protein
MMSASDPPTRASAGLHTKLMRWVGSPTFARDIVLVLALKLVLLLALKYAFFNHPQAQNMSMSAAEVGRAILSVPTTNPSRGDQHAHR